MLSDETKKNLSKYRKVVFNCLFNPVTPIPTIRATMKFAQSLAKQFDKKIRPKHPNAINQFWFDSVNLETELLERVRRLAKKGY